MIKVGLTGGIGSGKSTVASIFAKYGVPIYYADTKMKELMVSDPEIKARLIKEFGTEAYQNNELNRKYLASIVFDDKEKLQILNSITHPALAKDLEVWLKNKEHYFYVIEEAAILFESGNDKSMDKIICVTAPLRVRVERVMGRDKVSEIEVLRRMSNQTSEEERVIRSDYIIYNNSNENEDLTNLRWQVNEIHTKLLNLAKK